MSACCFARTCRNRCLILASLARTWPGALSTHVATCTVCILYMECPLAGTPRPPLDTTLLCTINELHPMQRLEGTRVPLPLVMQPLLAPYSTLYKHHRSIGRHTTSRTVSAHKKPPLAHAKCNVEHRPLSYVQSPPIIPLCTAYATTPFLIPRCSLLPGV